MKNELSKLREAMRNRNIDAYITYTSDYHMSEYISPHFMALSFISGFTGSNGILAVTAEEAALFTDGRYFLQAEKELRGSGITLVRSDDDAALIQYLREIEPRAVAADGRTISAKRARQLINALREARFDFSNDILDVLWEDRPPLPSSPVFTLSLEYSGMKASEKLAELRQLMAIEGVTAHLLTSLDDIAWLFNIRGGDIAYTPLALCYAVIEMEEASLFIDEGKLSSDVRALLKELGVNIEPYFAVYEYVRTFTKGDRVLLSSEKVNYALFESIEQRADIVDQSNPTSYAKSIKNDTERENLRRAHIKDGVAMAKLIYRLKTRTCVLTETDAAELADSLRKEQEGFISPSFSTIAGYGENGAIVHYGPVRGSDAEICDKGFLLLDSGGQYYEGTTDVTRTVACGPLTDEQRRHYTLVLKGLLAFSGCLFPRGCKGTNLDAIARLPLWNAGLNYAHGTGHGIGYFLCVHEPPVAIRYYAKTAVTLEPGMALSIEPGVYIEGSHGVRLENLLLVEEACDGFLRFNTLTLAPFDISAIDTHLLTHEERGALNAYHRRVYDEISLGLNEDERAWLEKATAPV